MSERGDGGPELYRISVYGCDDSTSVEMELTEQEAAVVARVAERITNTSTYQCMPTMQIRARAASSTEEAPDA